MSKRFKTILCLLIISTFIIPEIYACSAGCDACADDPNATAPEDCKTCKADYYHIEGKTDAMVCNLKTSPPDQYYFDTGSNTFKSCYTRCKRCSVQGTTVDDQKCEACAVGALIPNTGNCGKSDETVIGYFYDTDKWTRCWIGCAACNSAGSSTTNDCTACLDGYVKFNSQCLKKTNLPENYFYKTDGDTSFTQCGTNCATCTTQAVGDNQNCVTCKSPTTTKLMTLQGISNCYDINNPPANYSYDTGLKKWVFTGTCYQSCSKCSTSGDDTSHNCITCKAGYSLSDDSTKCYNSKPNGRYLDRVSLKWTPCDTSCASCLNGVSCETCPSDKYLNPSTKLCTAGCSVGWFKTENPKTCKQCIHPCLECDGATATSCLSCASGFNLLNKSCVTQNCPMNSMYKDEIGICLPCLSGCKTCSDGFTCDTCADGSFKLDGNCVKTCPNGFYLGTDTNGNKQCMPCDSSCQTCSDGTKSCQTCQPKFYRVPSKGICSPLCLETYVLEDNICKSCSEVGKSLFGNQCVIKCPSGYISVSGVCKSCQETGQFNFGGNCVSSCPDGYLHADSKLCYYANDKPLNFTQVYMNSVDITECDPQPCLNHGTCSTIDADGESIAMCTCPSGFYGKRCEYDLNKCKNCYLIFSNKCI
jgi:proprotein convertase subtilisin/kexin type 5